MDGGSVISDKRTLPLFCDSTASRLYVFSSGCFRGIKNSAKHCVLLGLQANVTFKTYVVTNPV